MLPKRERGKVLLLLPFSFNVHRHRSHCSHYTIMSSQSKKQWRFEPIYKSFQAGTSLAGDGGAIVWQKIARPSIGKVERTPTTYRNMINPITQGIKKKPMKNVTDPHSINARDIPSIIDANPAGEIGGNVG